MLGVCFSGPFPESLCSVHEKGTLRIAGNKFCPPYPDCFSNNAILLIDLEDMEKMAICEWLIIILLII